MIHENYDDEDYNENTNWGKIIAKYNTLLIGVFCMIMIGLNIFSNDNIANIPKKIITSKEIDTAIQGIYISENMAKPQKASINRINAGAESIYISEIFKQPLNSQQTGIEKGLLLANFFAQDTSDPQTFSFEALKLLGKITKILEIDLQIEIKKQYNRGIELENHLQQLKKLQLEGNNTFKQLTDLRIRTRNTWDQANNNANQIETEFFTYFDEFQSNPAEDKYQEFLIQKTTATRTKAELGVLMGLEERYQFALNSLNNRIKAIENNREAIILGMQLR